MVKYFGKAGLLVPVLLLAACATTPKVQDDPTPIAHKAGYTWKTKTISSGQTGTRWALVGRHPHSDAYQGDTSCQMSRPILCLDKVNKRSYPTDRQPDKAAVLDNARKYWTQGYLRVTKPVQGTLLTSRLVGDEICAKSFGAEYRMAEHHDSPAAWFVLGHGVIPEKRTFWVAIDDQPANCWDAKDKKYEAIRQYN